MRIWSYPIEETPQETPPPEIEETVPPEHEEIPAPEEEDIPPPPTPDIEVTTLEETVPSSTLETPLPEAVPTPFSMPEPWVRITTLGDLQLVQDPHDSEVTVTAEANHAGVEIQWRVEGDGKDFVELTSVREGTISRAILSLKRPAPETWGQDSQVELIASSGMEGLPEARASVRLVKFRRGGDVAPGASEICVPLRNGVPGGSWSFQPKRAYVYGTQDDSRMSRHVDDDPKTSRLAIHYQSADDRGEGTYRLRTQIGFRGLTRAATRYDEDSWGHQASIGVAAGILASVDNEPVILQNNSVGIRYGGYPSLITLGIATGPGLTVALALSDQKKMWDERRAEGVFVIESDGEHAPGSEIRIEKQVRIHAEILLEQTDDDEWNLAAEAAIETYFPVDRSAVDLCFSPKH
ncbi:MAG: hypothetical protein ACJ76J_22030 [Thermoanaerobaculia bacterium]